MSQLAVIKDLSAIGTVEDLPDFDLPVNAFSEAKEMQFQRGFVRRAGSYSNNQSTLGTPLYVIGEGPFYATATNVYLFNPAGGAPLDVTRAAGPYTGSSLNRWNHDWFSSLLVMNNGKDAPQGLAFGAAKLADLPAWPAGCRAQVVRTFRNFLVAYNVSKLVDGSLVPYPTMVKWSNSAAPFALPDSWDETDATKDAGEDTLIANSESIIDALPLNGSGGEVNLIYTPRTTWGMRLSGNNYIFYFSKVFDDIGILAQDCVKSFRRRHFLVTKDDIVIHDGFQAESVASDRVRETLFKELHAFNRLRYTYVVPFYSQEEMWVCYSEDGYNATKAFVWNWRLNTWTSKILPTLTAIAPTKISLVDSNKDGLIASNSTQILTYDQGYKGGVANSARLERRSCALSITPEGVPTIDPYVMKDYLSFHPQITGTAGKHLKIAFAVQDERNDAIIYGEEQDWVIGITKSLPIGLSGRFFSFYIEDESNNDPWQLEVLAVELTVLGRF